MKIITLNKWLNLFRKKDKVSFKVFLESSKVRKGNGELVSLIEHCKLRTYQSSVS